VVIFSFSGSAAAPARFIYISLHERQSVPPGQISICQVRHTAGRETGIAEIFIGFML